MLENYAIIDSICFVSRNPAHTIRQIALTLTLTLTLEIAGKWFNVDLN